MKEYQSQRPQLQLHHNDSIGPHPVASLEIDQQIDCARNSTLNEAYDPEQRFLLFSLLLTLSLFWQLSASLAGCSNSPFMSKSNERDLKLSALLPIPKLRRNWKTLPADCCCHGTRLFGLHSFEMSRHISPHLHSSSGDTTQILLCHQWLAIEETSRRPGISSCLILPGRNDIQKRCVDSSSV